jgi:DNA-binding GntR family transcriptional regulator
VQIRRETLGAQVYDLLRDRLLRGEIAGGARLVQGPLSEEMGISRIPIRDALRRLEADGLVTGDEIGRYTVVPFELGDANEIYAIRRRLEPLAVEAAARAMTPETLADIRSLHEELTRAVRRRQLDRYLDLNLKFHMSIYEASGMRRLVRIIRGLWQGVPPLTPVVVEGRLRRSQKEHEEILKFLAKGDAAGAAEALDRHIENAAAELIASIASTRGARKAARARS